MHDGYYLQVHRFPKFRKEHPFEIAKNTLIYIMAKVKNNIYKLGKECKKNLCIK